MKHPIHTGTGTLNQLDTHCRLRKYSQAFVIALGGISNGEDIYFRVAIKPVSTISKKQRTLTRQHKETNLEASGRHDPCVLPRAVSIVDAMAALTVMDHYLRHKAQNL